MIGKIKHNSSFRATLGYVLGKPDASVIGGNMAGDSLRELVYEFRLSSDLNPNVKRPVYHISLSLPHQDHLSDVQFGEVAQKYLERMGLDPFEHQYLAVRHRDKAHDHIHVVASRINFRSGRAAKISWDYYRSQAVTRQLEQEYELQAVPSCWDVGKRSESKGQIETFQQTGKESIQKRLQVLVDAASQGETALPGVVEQLMEQGVSVAISRTKTGAVQGISYKLDGVAISGSKLGNRYSLPGLERRGIDCSHREIAQTERLFQQASYVQHTQPMVLQLLPLFRHLNITLLDGQRYRLRLRSLGKGKGQELSIYKKSLLFPSPVKLFSMETDGKDDTSASFSLKDTQLTQQDCQHFVQVAQRLQALQPELSQAPSKQSRFNPLKSQEALSLLIE